MDTIGRSNGAQGVYSSIRSTVTSALPPTFKATLRYAREAAYIRGKHVHRASTSLRKLTDTARLVSWPKKTVLFYPDSPEWIAEYVAFQLCALLGYRVINDPNWPHDVVLKFHDSTFSTPEDLTPGISNLDEAINGRSLNISKRFIQRTFARVFGYPLGVDPTQYEGRVVVKSNENYTHDGRIVECPIPASGIEEGHVYQKAIDTRTDDGYFLDYRVPIIGGVIPIVYLKYSAPSERFSSETSHIELAPPEDVFTPSEMQRMIEFAQAMNLDYGEFDVLRHRSDERIYVVDVANTPTRPDCRLTDGQRRKALYRMIPPFKKLTDRFSS